MLLVTSVGKCIHISRVTAVLESTTSSDGREWVKLLLDDDTRCEVAGDDLLRAQQQSSLSASWFNNWPVTPTGG